MKCENCGAKISDNDNLELVETTDGKQDSVHFCCEACLLECLGG